MLEFLIFIACIIVSFAYLKYAPMHDLRYVLAMREAERQHRHTGENKTNDGLDNQIKK
jgi:hypothetical protein